MKGVGILIILLVALSVLLIIAIVWLFGWRSKYNEAIKAWGDESESKDEQIFKLQEEIKLKESWGRTIKIETVRLEPKEFECKFLMHERYINDKELCKKLMVSEAARYLAEEFEKDPYLYTVFTERNYAVLQDFIKIKFRMLPYAEPASFNDIFKEDVYER